jgi:hypothetical protein
MRPVHVWCSRTPAGIRCAHFSYCNHNTRGSGHKWKKLTGVDCMMLWLSIALHVYRSRADSFAPSEKTAKNIIYFNGAKLKPVTFRNTLFEKRQRYIQRIHVTCSFARTEHNNTRALKGLWCQKKKFLKQTPESNDTNILVSRLALRNPVKRFPTLVFLVFSNMDSNWNMKEEIWKQEIYAHKLQVQ